MKLHPRTLVVDEARAELTRAFTAIETKYDLTYGEMFSLLGERMHALARYLIRAERHPDAPDKKGDEA